MKLFFRHKDNPNPRQQDREHNITLTDRNYFLLDDNDAALKFRMTEELERMVDEICSYLDTSASDFIRQVLFIHLYGRYDLLGLLERQFPVLDERRRMVIPSGPDESPAKSRNVADCKVWLPRVMKDDLAFLAQTEGVTLSRYVRNVITTHLTGHTGLVDRSPVNRPLNAPITTRVRKK